MDGESDRPRQSRSRPWWSAEKMIKLDSRGSQTRYSVSESEPAEGSSPVQPARLRSTKAARPTSGRLGLALPPPPTANTSPDLHLSRGRGQASTIERVRCA
ncbi:unnamed protein product [Pleuronectes platessa]|uniref:Uncharacterized protein n=1 Tax=Pleuronectes platessa TaxID=8262 RepID=A0A9N7UM06_PLEPL|nr:unnamed protein product [Pleuronectes platessa]